MFASNEIENFLAGSEIGQSVFELQPDYRCLLVVITNVEGGASDGASEKLLQQAESKARDYLRDVDVEELPHIAAWRRAFQAFGAKPQRTRNSAEALLRRAVDGLPRVNRITDVYNAISVAHQIPIGGEDLARYQGSPRLIRSTGLEPFDTVADGSPIMENPEIGEVIWTDSIGVTCRRWNWRQGSRTRITETTTDVLFILDALNPITDKQLLSIGDELVSAISKNSSESRSFRRLLSAQDIGG